MVKYPAGVMLAIMSFKQILLAGPIMPALDRVRKKVDEIRLNGPAPSAGSLEKILKGMKTPDGLKDLQEVQAILSGLYWSGQRDFITTLVQLKKDSQLQAAHYLKDKIKEKCTGSRSPLIMFAQELAHEDRQLQQVFNMLLKCLDGKKTQDSGAQALHEKLKVVSDSHAQCVYNLQQLIDVSNALLME